MSPFRKTIGVTKAVFVDLFEVFASKKTLKTGVIPDFSEESRLLSPISKPVKDIPDSEDDIPVNLPVANDSVFRTVADAQSSAPAETEKTETDTSPSFSKKLYVNSEIGLRARATPKIAEGNILDILPFGAEIFLSSQDGKWLYVEYGPDKYGWVSSYYVTENNPKTESAEEAVQDTQNIFPKFMIGAANPANGENTIKVRILIKDEFSGGRDGFCLQCTEYVAYKLQCFGIRIKWPVKSGRDGGRWAEIFKTYDTYPVMEEPKAGSAVVFTSGFKTAEANALGHVAFVEKVYKNGVIRISEANWPTPGKYNERILSSAEWRDKYKGKFIIFT